MPPSGHPAELSPKREPQRRLALRPYARAVAQVLRVSFRASPGAVVMKVLGSLISAVLPLVTTYFAALTTTALAAAYAGDTGAGRLAIVYVIITAALGLFWGAFNSTGLRGMVGLERATLPLIGEQDFGLGSSAAVLSFIAANRAGRALVEQG